LFEFENIFDLDLNHGFKFISAAKELQNKFYYPGQPKKVFSPIHRPAHHPLTGLALQSMFMFFAVGLVAFGPSDLASPPAAHFPFHPPPSKQRCCRLVPPAGRCRVVPPPVALLCSEEVSRPMALCLPWKWLSHRIPSSVLTSLEKWSS
jgi:hypothetical protein